MQRFTRHLGEKAAKMGSMQYYLVLSVFTVIIVTLALLVWIKIKSIIFPLGIAFMYYLSLYGSWSIITDKSGGDSVKNYHYLENKLFPVYLDDYYLWTLILYAVFIVIVELVVLLTVNCPKLRKGIPEAQVRVSHGLILLISSISGILSYLIIREDLQKAVDMQVAAYEIMKRGLGEVSPYFTVHQVLNRIALVPAVLGFVILCSGKSPRMLAGKGNWNPAYLVGYLLVIGGMLWLAFLLGYKSELFYPGMVACLFYLANAERPRTILMAVAGFVILTGMWLIDLLRFVPMAQLAEEITGFGVPDLADVFNVATLSNEPFAAHFSMYGALEKDIPSTYGSSLLSLIASVIPRIVWPDRPQDIYSYYATSVHATEGQGYTINHATGWYLNFGILGMAIGAVLLGLIWAKCFNSYNNLHVGRRHWYYIFATLAPWVFTAYIPFLMRAGPEVYKGLIIEGFMVPVGVLTLSSYRWRIFPQYSKKQADSKDPLKGLPQNNLDHLEASI